MIIINIESKKSSMGINFQTSRSLRTLIKDTEKVCSLLGVISDITSGWSSKLAAVLQKRSWELQWIIFFTKKKKGKRYEKMWKQENYSWDQWNKSLLVLVAVFEHHALRMVRTNQRESIGREQDYRSRNHDLHEETELIVLVNFQGEKTSGRHDSPIFQDVKCCWVVSPPCQGKKLIGLDCSKGNLG